MYNYQKREASSYTAQDQQSRSKPEDAVSNYQSKMKVLGRVKYINQLARL